MLHFNSGAIAELIVNAENSSRGRAAFSLHPADFVGPRVLVNVVLSRSYVRPHKHDFENGQEIYQVLRGKLGVVKFDDYGKVLEKVILDEGTGGVLEMPSRTYHSAVSLSPFSVLTETTQGPYRGDIENKVFAPWSPEEETAEAIAYLQTMKELFRK